ncbi:MAG: hypothetical protein MJ066_03325 [Clostridia bacterium]|nr:hypothetical protein [Clostridia bacterium]
MGKYSKIFDEKNIKEFRSIPFWSWNDKLEIDELRRQIRWMKEQGFGGYFMHARGGLTTEYLGKKWFDCVNACLDEGEKCGMQSWAYDENGWPSGFVGGKLIEDPENCDKYLTYTIGAFDKKALVSYKMGKTKLVRTDKGGEGKFLNIFEHTSISTADILNPKVVDKFIKQTHELYKKKTGENFGKLLKGFFTDEPQFYRSAHPYTKVLPKAFKDKYNEDILDGLGLMFVEKEGYRSFRYKYWKLMQELMLNNYAKKVYDWCESNGVGLTGHYIEELGLEDQMLCCAGIMPFYQYETIPGVDHLCRIMLTPVLPKQVSSVAEQTGKKKVLTETFALCGWDVTPKELKRIAEWQYVNGVNTMCEHLMPYSEHGQRKRDYPAHYSWVNPWVREGFKGFNDYFARLGYLLANSKQKVNVAILSPIRSVYFSYKRESFRDGKPAEYKVIDESYKSLCTKLSQMNIPYHIIDETVLSNIGSVEGSKIKVGKCAYDYIVFPKTLTLDKNTKDLFEKFYANGGKMLFTDTIPTYVEGDPYKYNFKTNTTYKDIINDQQYCIDKQTTDIQSTMREYNGEKFIYAVNLSDTKDYTVTFKGKFNSFVKLDLETGKTEKISNKIHFKPSESMVLFVSKKKIDFVSDKPKITLKAPYTIKSETDNYLYLDKIKYSFDGVKYSKKLTYMGVFHELLKKRYDGNVYLKYEFEVKDVPTRISFLSEDLHNISCKVNGKEIKFTGESDFERKIYRADIAKFVQAGHNEVVLKIHFYESEDVYYALFGKNVTEGLKNKLAYDTTIEAAYLQGDFGVYSKGGFTQTKDSLGNGVKNEMAKVYVSDDDFYIAERKSIIKDTVKEGYPFFAGTMTLESKFISDGKPCILKLKGRYGFCKLKINGKSVDKSYFATEADISNYVKKGENTAEITLYSANRNLLGPHHYIIEECFSIGPGNFELFHTKWKNGKSEEERDNYY